MPDALACMCRDITDMGGGGAEGVAAGAASAEGAAKGEEGVAGDLGVDEQVLSWSPGLWALLAGVLAC